MKNSLHDHNGIVIWFCFGLCNHLHGKKSLKIPKGKQNPHIVEEQTTQWSKEIVQTTIYKT